MIVQIYGTKTIEDAKALIELGVDYIGLDVADDPDDRALMKQIVDLVRGRMTTVLLPVFCDLETGLRIVHEIKPDVMHFCATDMLPLSEARAIRKELGRYKDAAGNSRWGFPAARIKLIHCLLPASTRRLPTSLFLIPMPVIILKEALKCPA